MCKIGEIKIKGYEGIDSATSTHKCVPKLLLDGSFIDLAAEITYDGALTPKITKITPRYGSVVGGDVITFDGENFNTNMASISIVLDGKICDIS